MVDIVLPNINGFELYWRIKRLDDKIKVCFITASKLYYEEVRKETIPKLDTSYFIKKPISNEELAKASKKYAWNIAVIIEVTQSVHN